VPQIVTRSKRIERKTAMNHAAIDLGGKESQICIRQPDGTIIEERKVPTRKLTELVGTWARVEW
jgi:predicted NBD/HSP70 family sugar kinase